MESQNEQEVLKRLKMAGLTDTNVADLIGWADLPSFPLNEAVRLCGGAYFKLHFSAPGRNSYATIDAKKAIELTLGFAFPCEVTMGHVAFETPIEHWEICEQDLSMARYYCVFLAARLWAIRHAPGDLPPSKELQELYDYLRQVPTEEDPNFNEIFSLLHRAGLKDEFDADLGGWLQPVKLDARQIAEEIPPKVVECKFYDDRMTLRYYHSPSEVYNVKITRETAPYIEIFRTLTNWLEKHPD